MHASFPPRLCSHAPIASLYQRSVAASARETVIFLSFDEVDANSFSKFKCRELYRKLRKVSGLRHLPQLNVEPSANSPLQPMGASRAHCASLANAAVNDYESTDVQFRAQMYSPFYLQPAPRQNNRHFYLYILYSSPARLISVPISAQSKRSASQNKCKPFIFLRKTERISG